MEIEMKSYDENENKENRLQNEIEPATKPTIQRTSDILVGEEFTFSKFPLSDKLQKSLERLNYIKPSPIQLKVVPLAKCGLDMIIQAKSGTGKTLAFAICLLESYEMDLKFPQSLVVVPTREIAVQIFNVLNDLGRSFKNFKAHEFIGGTEVANDRKKIQSAQVVVGTPGRILHLIQSEIFNISNLKTLVLDEADKLLENGQMAKDVTSILKLMNKKIQIIATTATVTSHLERIMKKTMKNPIGITPKHEAPVLLGIKQFVKILPREVDNIRLMNQKIEELHKIFSRITFKQCLLFTDSQSKTESYGNYLKKRGWKNESINGAHDQSHRLRVLDKLVNFKCRILITTDLMARGIDIENINLIINLDLPYDCFTYLHRIGRAGRFGTHGIAISFVNGEEDLMKLQKILGDIGGDTLNVLKFPDESTHYDFWDFKQDDGSVLEKVSGFSKSDDEEDEDEIIKKSGTTGSEGETMLNNLALLEITRKLIDDKSNETEAFDLNSILEDYERTMKNPSNESHRKPATNGGAVNGIEEENIFQKTIEELENDDVEENVQKIEIQKPKSKNQIIFKRSTDDNEYDEISSSSHNESFDSSSHSSSNENESDHEEEMYQQEATKPRKETIKQRERTKQSYNEAPCASSKNHNQYTEFDRHVAYNYSQWENIFYHQLAHIENYVSSSKK